MIRIKGEETQEHQRERPLRKVGKCTNTKGSTRTPERETIEKDAYQASFVSSARTDFMWRISPAMRKQTPMGARWTTQEVTCKE